MSEKILIIDDEERILHTFARILRLEGYTVFAAEGAAAGIECYERERPAITFVDLRMPGQDGFAVLQAIRAQDPDAEVILMTGHGDKDTVIAALRADASDFISKPVDAETLGNVLRRAQERLQWKRELRATQAALRESHANLEQQVAARTAELAATNAALQQRNQELSALNAALQESETRFRDIFEQAAVGLSHSALDGTFIRVNQRFCDIVGYTQAELTQVTFQDITHPDDLDNDLTHMRRLLTGDLSTYTLEKRYYRKDGVLIWVTLTVSLACDLNGAPQYIIGVVEDITARRQAQAALRESEERYRLIFHNSPVGILRYDTALHITDCNTQIANMLQSTQERMLGFNMHTLNDRRILPALESVLAGEEGCYEGWYHATTGPAQIWVTFRTTPLHDSAGHIVGGVGIAEDFTARRQMEEALRASEARYRWLVESSPDIIYRYRLHPTPAFEYVSPAVTALTGYTPEEHYTNPDLGRRLIHPDDQSLLENIFYAPEAATTPLMLRWIRKDGAVLWTEHRLTLFRDESGVITALQGIAHDVTEHHQLESVEAFLAQAVNLSLGGWDFFSALARYLAESLRMDYVCIDRLFGDQRVAQTVAVYYDGHFEDNVTYTLQDTPCGAAAGKILCSFPQNVRHLFPQDETLQQIGAESYIGVTLWGSDGQPIGLIAVIGRRPLDNPHLAEAILKLVAIRAARELERQQVEMALRESEQRYRQIAESITDVIWILDLETARFQYVSPAVEALRGYTVAEVMAQDMAAAVSPESLRHIQQVLPERIAAFQQGRQESYTDLIEQPCKDGSTVWTEVVTHYYRNAQTGHLEAYGVSRDITERRKAELALRQSDERLKEAQRIARLGRWELDLRSDHLYWSEGIYEIFELDPHKFGASYQAFLDTIHPDDRDNVNRAYVESLETRQPYEITHRLWMQDGRVKWVHEICRTEYDANGSPLRSIGVVQDVTAQQQVEDALRETEMRYRLLFEEMQSGFALHEVLCDAGGHPYDYRFLDVNPAFERLTGLRRADLIGKTVLAIMPETEPYWIERYSAVALTGEPCHFENFSQELDRYYSVVAYRPKPGQFAVIFSDVTDRKRAEKALQESEEKYRLLFETMLQGVVYQAADGQITSANPAAERILGLSLDQMQGRTSFDPHWRAIHEDGSDFPGETHPGMVALRTGQVVRDVVMGVYHPTEDHYVWININAMPQFRPGHAAPSSVYATFEDITARRQVEQENLRLASFPQLNPDPILELNASGALTFYNQAAVAAAHRLNGGDVHDFIPPDIADILAILAQQQEMQFYREVTVGAATFGEYLHTTPTFRCVRIYAHDITGRKEAEAFMRLRLQLVEYAASHSLDELLQETLDKIGALTDSPIGFYHFVEPDQKTLSLQAWSTRTLREFCKARGKGLHYPVDEAGVWVDCVYQQQPVIHNDYMALPHRKGLPEGHAPVIREMVVPVMRRQQVVAILGIGNRATDYTERDVEIVSYLADIAWEIAARKRAEEQLQKYAQQLEYMVAEKVAELDRERLKTIHSARMVALGELATGIAHELRQPLTAMQFDADYLHALAQQWQASNLPAPGCSPAELGEVSQNIVADIARANRLIDHLRVFGRMPETAIAPTDLNQAIEDSLLLTRERLRQHNIDVQIHLSPNLPFILANTHKLEQVFLNFISNAEYALAEQESRIKNQESRIKKRETLTYQKRLEIATYTEGESVIARVRDNGCGIPPEVLPRIFEPFFTTKPAGEGTGLGLPICMDIVREFGGEIAVASETGAGATFVLRFPIMSLKD